MYDFLCKRSAFGIAAHALFAIAAVSPAHTAMMGQRPMRSGSAPMTGSQMKFDRPTQSVTSRLSRVLSLSTLLPNVGVYTVIR